MEGQPDAPNKLLQFILRNISDEIFLRKFLPSALPPVLALLQKEDATAFGRIVRAFEEAASGPQPFDWTDTAAIFLGRIFTISNDPAIRELVLKRILVMGTEHNRWAVRDIYVQIVAELKSPHDVLMVARQLSEYPEGCAFMRPAFLGLSLPPKIQDALAA